MIAKEIKINDDELPFVVTPEIFYIEKNNRITVKNYTLCLMIGDYYDNHETLFNYYYKSYNNNNTNYEIVAYCIINVLNNIQKINKDIYFHHGDLKVNNVILDINSLVNNNLQVNIDSQVNINSLLNNSFLFDFEFSTFLEDDKYIVVNNNDDFPIVNRYLLCQDNFRINGLLLSLFDYYYFAFSIITNFYESSGKIFNYINLIIDKYKIRSCTHIMVFHLFFILLHKEISKNSEIYINDYYLCNIKNIIIMCKRAMLVNDSVYYDAILWIKQVHNSIIALNKKNN